jgi:putative ABC transport system permease protein
MAASASSRLANLLHWNNLYSETELCRAAVRVYTNPLLQWRKALSTYSTSRHMRQVNTPLIRWLSILAFLPSVLAPAILGCKSREYTPNQTQVTASDLVFAYYEGNNGDFLTTDDMRAVQQQVQGIKEASPLLEIRHSISVGSGARHDMRILGVAPEYASLCKIEVHAGRFFDSEDSTERVHVAEIAQQLAIELYGSEKAAIGKEIKIAGLPFVIIGAFREGVESFGQSSIPNNTILIPYSVGRVFSATNKVNVILFSVTDAHDIQRITALVRQIIQSQHRPQSIYHIETLRLMDPGHKH